MTAAAQAPAPTAPGAPQPQRRSRGDVLRTLASGLGQVFVTAGIVALLFVVYLLYITGLFMARDQQALNDDLDEIFAAPASVRSIPPGIGDAFARLYLPDIGVGADDPLAVVQGVGTDALKKGPGHLPSSQLPGQLGNLVISGHRTTYGAPFGQIDKLDNGDEIVVETAASYFTYTVVGSEIVRPSAVEVTFPVPHQPGEAPARRLVTLTTCHPKYSAERRLIVYGELRVTDRKVDGVRPVALAGG